MKNTIENPNVKFNPTNQWYENYRMYSLDYYMVDTLLGTMEEHPLNDVIEGLDDSYFLHQNFPSFSEDEMIEFIEEDYMNVSPFIKNLRDFIHSQKVLLRKTQKNFSDEEKEWIDENLNY
jgi:hypothetical protein